MCAVAPTAVLLASVANFVVYHGYPLDQPEVGLLGIGLVVTGLALGLASATGKPIQLIVMAGAIVFLLDVQLERNVFLMGHGKLTILAGAWSLCVIVLWLLGRHAGRLVSLVAGTMVVTTLATLTLGNPRPDEGTPGAARLPLVVHVVLDGHAGFLDVMANDAELVELVRSTYRSAGFRIFEGAFSEYPLTTWSLGHLLDLSPGGFRVSTATNPPAGFQNGLQSNRYFAGMVQSGYRVRVLQSTGLDVCANTVGVICETYVVRGLGVLTDLSLSIREKAELLVSTYLSRSRVLERLLPGEMLARPIAPVSSIPQVDKLVARISAAKRGDFFFAHVLLPHGPFIYDSRCRLLPSGDWLESRDFDRAYRERMRTRLEQRYLEQLKCSLSVVDRIANAIPVELRRDAIVLIHGDHGSRLDRMEISPGEPLTPADIRTALSTLFAARLPSRPGGSDDRALPITCILAELVATDFGGEVAGACRTDHAYFPDENGNPVKVALPPEMRRRPVPYDGSKPGSDSSSSMPTR